MQFFIEAVDSGLPNIIDSLLINLDILQLGADFTEEMTFAGYHNISHMTMSFRVACANGYCGRDCTATRTNNPRILSCNFADGDIVCKEKYDPSANCNGCLHNLNFSTNCSTCIEPTFDPDTNCSTCLNTNYDPSTYCTTCLPSYDPVTNCTTCLDSRFDPDNDCTSCLLEGHDLLTNCTQCLPNRDFSTNCTTCMTGYTGENCAMSELIYTSQRDFTCYNYSAKHPSKAQCHTVNECHDNTPISLTNSQCDGGSYCWRCGGSAGDRYPSTNSGIHPACLFKEEKQQESWCYKR